MSVEGVHEIVALVDVTADEVSPVGTLGGVTSGDPAVVTANGGLDCAELFPAASNADTV